MQGIHGSVGSCLQRNTDTYRAREFHFGIFEGDDVAHRQLGIRSFFDANSAANENWHIEFYFFLEAFECLRKYQHVDRTGHVFQAGLRVEVALLRFQNAKIGDHSRGIDFVLGG